MRYKKKAVALVAVLAGVLAGEVATASAGTAVVSSGGNIAAPGPSARLVIGGSIPMNCTTSSATATMPNGTFTAPTGPVTIASSAQLTFGGCVVGSGIGATLVCPNSMLLRATSNSVAGTTPILVAYLGCDIAIPIVGCTANLINAFNGSYSNSGSLKIFAVNLLPQVVNSTCPPAVLPNGSARLGGTGAGATGLVDLVYTLGAVKPQVNATGF